VSADDFQFAVAIAGACIGLSALLLLALVTVMSTWRLFRHAEQASQAASRSSLAVEEMIRRFGPGPGPSRPGGGAPGEEFGELRREASELMERQARLQETVRNLIESGMLEGGPSAESLQNLEQTVQRLETTMGQMVAAVANLMQEAEREES